MTALGEISLATLLAVAAAMTLLWIISIAARDSSIVDIFWGIGFTLIAWMPFALGAHLTLRKVAVVALTTLWGLRLAVHLAWRNVGQGEDARYRAMREHHGRSFPIVSLYLVFGLQGALMWVVSLPIQATQATSHAAPLGLWDALGVGVWGLGFVIESVADYQLLQFRSARENSGRVMDQGLWAWSRHPNYFGDALVWWGLYGFAAATGQYWTALGPALMTGLLLRVSGVPMLERRLRETRPGYAEYAAHTSAFLPWPPRRREPLSTMP